MPGSRRGYLKSMVSITQTNDSLSTHPAAAALAARAAHRFRRPALPDMVLTEGFVPELVRFLAE